MVVIHTQVSRPRQFFIAVSAFLFSCLLATFVNAAPGKDQGKDIEYAEHMSLATTSLLLDITRVGDTLVAVGERGHVVTSLDGVSWKQADVVPTRATLATVYSVGNRLWAGGHDATLITSGDKGKTWTRQFFDPDRQQAVMDILFTDENNGVAIGSYGLYLQTGDGGRTWEDGSVDPESDYHLNAMLRFDDGRRLIAGEAGYSYRSFDDGLSWEAINMPYQGSMWGALRTDGACVLFYGLRGHVLESCDFGSIWTELETGSKSSISDAAKAGGTVLLAANGGTIVLRRNGVFSVHHHSSGVDFSAVLALGDGHFLLTGEGGIYYYPETGETGNGDD